MHKLFAFLLFFMSYNTFVEAQVKQYTSAADSDPEAVSLLEGIRKKYDAYRTLSANFRLDITLPGQGVESQEGEMKRQGELVRFKLGPQEGIITSEAAYLIQHANEEIVISNLPEEGEETGILTPQTLFNFYEGDNYVLALQGSETINGKKLSVVELKPVDRNNSDFTKLRIYADGAAKEIASVSAFTPDGAVFKFTLNDTRGNASFADDVFVFNKKDFPGYYVEDMRQ